MDVLERRGRGAAAVMKDERGKMKWGGGAEGRGTGMPDGGDVGKSDRSDGGKVRFSIDGRDSSLEHIQNADMVSEIRRVIDEGVSENKFRFKRPEDKQKIIDGAKKFFDEFSKKKIDLSNGHFVYFMPDIRAFERGAATAWAEYCIHAVTSSGKRLAGKEYSERLYNHTKFENLDRIEPIIKEENVFGRFDDKAPHKDAVVFVGQSHEGKRLEIITRLDDYGNVNADLTEVTVVATNKEKENPPNKPLSEVVATVAQHQAAGFSPSTDNNLSQNPEMSTGEVKKGVGKSDRSDEGKARFMLNGDVYSLENAISSKDGYNVERVNENAGRDLNAAEGVVCEKVNQIFDPKDAPEKGFAGWVMEKIQEWEKAHPLKGAYPVPALNGDVNLTSGSFRSIGNHGGPDEKYNLIPAIPDLLKHAILIQTENSSRSKSHILASKIRYGSDQRYIAVMVIHESNGKFYYDHSLLILKEGALGKMNQAETGNGNPENQQGSSSHSARVLNVAQKALLSSGFDTRGEKNIRFSMWDYDEGTGAT